jgi:signal transduction histidine kinase
MKRPSFSTQLVALWALVAAICAMLVALAWFMASLAGSQQITSAKQQATAVCEAVTSRYNLSGPLSGAAANSDLMHAVLDIVLAQAQGVEGGFWTASPTATGAPPDSGAAMNDNSVVRHTPQNGFLAYAFPTYQGSGIKRDVPEAETPLILRTLRSAAATRASTSDVIQSGQDAVVAVACPVPGQADMFAWMLTRARPPLGQYGEALVAALASILAVILVVAIALALTLRRWKGNLTRLEAALSPQGDIEHAAHLPRLGEPDLDKIVDALNLYVVRAELLQRQTADLGSKLAQAERFGILGKLAAQLAHEIRNPAGAMRLKAENALAGDSERQQGALRFILEQIGRIETQVASLLALTQPVNIDVKNVNVAAWLPDIVESHRELAQKRHVRLMLVVRPDGQPPTEAPDLAAFDPEQLRRAIDNLLLNALRHVGDGGMVTVTVQRDCSSGCARLRIAVSDDGPGVPAGQREHVFEPFVTGRPEGSGLGLAVVREVASAHGGTAYLDDSSNGARFVIEIPWQPSS